MSEDLEIVPFEVLSVRLKRFFQDDLPAVLGQAWQRLEWHVDNRCAGCEYLGYPWLNSQGQSTAMPDHCMPTANTIDHLSRIAFVSRGASNTLQIQGVPNVINLAGRLPNDQAFDSHQALRAQRTVISSRAQSLQHNQPYIAANSGTSAVMPKWTDLRIYLTVDFDIGSAISFAFGLKAFWLKPVPFGNPNNIERVHHSWNPIIHVIDRRSVQSEQRQLLNLLRDIDEILRTAQARDADTKVQFYIWDQVQYEHLKRVIGRHLQAVLADQTIMRLAWLFPPEDVVANSAQVTRRSPMTVIKDVVRAVLAAPIPHYYSMLQVARVYHEVQLPANIARFSVHPLFEDILSDQIPSERAHEIWTQSARPPYAQQQARLVETVQKRLNALETITKRLETDLRSTLGQNAPKIAIGPPPRQMRMSTDGQLWFAFAKLDNSLAELDVHMVRAMPPHEREARFHSARLSRRLLGSDATVALNRIGLQLIPGRRVYEMLPTSREVKMKDGNFNFALSPENQAGYLDRNFQWHVRGTQLQNSANEGLLMEDITQVTIKAVDRDHLIVVIDPQTRNAITLDELEQYTFDSFTSDIILDPIHRDYFTKKLQNTLQAIGNPPQAQNSAIVQRATGQLLGRGARRSQSTPIANLLWEAPILYHTPVHRNLPSVRTLLVRHGLSLNATQWNAWHEALSRRLQIIWGPPGTGKSRTARAIIVGAVLEAIQNNKNLRVLICASTYNAMDNVLLKVDRDVQQLCSTGTVQVKRLRSYLQAQDASVPNTIDVALNRLNPSQQVLDLIYYLQSNSGITIVGAPPEQVHNLMQVNNNSQEELFDLILIDEASQMDVAHSILALSGLSSEGSIILTGDPKQLPPIHKAKPPIGLETMVGSVYSFYESFHGIPTTMLDENYRSNSTIVDFAVEAGYRANLASYSPDLRLNFIYPLPSSEPIDWPINLYWTPEWATLLDPEIPTTCFVYVDGQSSQWNRFEADTISALIRVLYGRLGNNLLNELDPLTGTSIPASNTPYSALEFWQKAIGIVTPHRAQRGLIVSQLEAMFGGNGLPQDAIRNAVDTVERFQGQQRDIMIASFALGDPDEIAEEDEFLMSLNRFNVMSSRARAKLIVLVSQEIVNHLSSDLETLHSSRLLKVYAESFCNNHRTMNIGFLKNGSLQTVPGIYRYR